MEELSLGLPKGSAVGPIASHRGGPRNEKKRLTQIPLRAGAGMSRSVDSLPAQSNLNIVANQVLGSREHDMIAEEQFVKSLERGYMPAQYSDRRNSEKIMSLPSVRPSDTLHPWSKLLTHDQEPEHHQTFLDSPHRDDSDAISELTGHGSTQSMLSQMSFISAGGRHHPRQPARRKSHYKSQVPSSRVEVLQNEEKTRARALKAYFDCISDIYNLQGLQFDLDHAGVIHKDLSAHESKDVKHTLKSRILMKQLLNELKDTVVTTSHKELLPLIFTIVEDENNEDQLAAAAAAAAATVQSPAAAASAAASSLQYGMQSFRKVLPSSGGAVRGSVTGSGGGGTVSVSHRGRYNTKFSYSEWLASHKLPHQHQQQQPSGAVDSLPLEGSKLSEKQSRDKQKETENLMKAINTYVEIKFIELKEKSLHMDNTPSKKKAVIAADLLLKLTSALSSHCSTLVPLVYDLLSCVFSDYNISAGNHTLNQTEIDFNKMHTYVDKFSDLCEQAEDLEIEKNWSSTGVKMQQIVKKFQTVRIVFDHSARFVRDTCFKLWKSLLMRNQFFLVLCRRRRLRYILKQWKAHNDAVVQAASEDETELLMPGAGVKTARRVHIQEHDGNSPDRNIGSATAGAGGVVGALKTGRRRSAGGNGGGSLPGSRRPSLDDILKERKKAPLKSHKSMLNMNISETAVSAAGAGSSSSGAGSVAAPTISPPMKRGGSVKNMERGGSVRNILTSSDAANNTPATAATAAGGGRDVGSAGGGVRRGLSKKVSPGTISSSNIGSDRPPSALNGDKTSDILATTSTTTSAAAATTTTATATQATTTAVPETVKGMGGRPVPLLKRSSANNLLLLSSNTVREATEQEMSQRSFNNENKKFSIAELNASKRNISLRSFKFSSSTGAIKFNVMTQTPDTWMEDVHEPVDFDDAAPTISHMRMERDHHSEGIKITEQLISWIYSSLVPDPKQKKTAIDFYQYKSLLAYSKAYLSYKFASKRLATKFFHILKTNCFNDTINNKRIDLFCSLCGIDGGVLNPKFNMTRYEAFVGLLGAIFVNSAAFVRATLNSPNHDIKREQVLDAVPGTLPTILRRDPELYRHVMDEIITLKPTVKTDNPKEAKINVDDVLLLLLDYAELEANEQIHDIFPYVRTGTTQQDNKFALKQININQIHKM